MATAIDEKLKSLQEKVESFAREQVAVREDLGRQAEFPWDLWRMMSENGLLGVGLPESHGGGGDFLSLAVAGEVLVREGGNMGLALSLGLHHLVGRFLINGFGTPNQKAKWLPELAAGRITGCLAASEPGTGAHPKHMKTSAELKGDTYFLTGEKTYLTNGPIAGLFVVMAITGGEGSNKRITAFLVPKDTPGLETSDLNLDLLRPSPHGSLKFDNSPVSAENLLGREGAAYETILKPFREMEDALLLGPIAGGLARQLKLTARLIGEAEEDTKAAMGRLAFLVHTVRVLAYEVANMMDDDPEGHEEFLPLLLAGRDINRRFQEELSQLTESLGLQPGPALASLTRDLQAMGKLAGGVAYRKQVRLGAGFLQSKK